MILGSQVEMEGYFFILFLGVAFLCGIIFIGYFQESNGITCKITGNFIASENEFEEVYVSNVVKSTGHIYLNQNMIDETNRIKKLVEDGNIVLYPIKNIHKDLN
jgi:hypothetical protein